MNWSKIALVLSSNLFFVASCTGITFVSAQSMTHVGGKYMALGEVPDPRMMLIASIPDPGAPGKWKLTQVSLANLPKFQSAQPALTFVVPPGEGNISDELAGTSTSYRVKALGTDRVEVETNFFHFGTSTVARYEATRRAIKPIYTNVTDLLGAFFAGLTAALILKLFGSAVQRRRQRAR